MIAWMCKHFDDLTPIQLYWILQLRSKVFVVEQHCVFQDADDKDPFCHHLMALEDEQLQAYARIVPPGISYRESSIGRVVTSPLVRGSGLGHALMKQSIEAIYRLYGPVPIRIGAQLYLEKFYSSFQFQTVGPIYLEDGIKHIEMLLQNGPDSYSKNWKKSQ